MKVYVIAENMVVMDSNDGDGLENTVEPIVCIPLGAFKSRTKADKKCKKLNKDWNRIQGQDGIEGEEHYTVEIIEVK